MDQTNFNIDELKKLSSVIEVQQKLQPSPEVKRTVSFVQSNNTLGPVQQVKSIGPSVAPSVSTVPIVATNSSLDTTLLNNPNIMNICGMNLPKSTLYLVIVLIAIGLIIWYTTKSKNVNKNKDKKET
jgi:hypothetical protein